MSKPIDISLKWQRDPDVTFPSIWHTFRANAQNSDDLRDYVIRDMRPEEFDDFFEIFIGTYIRDGAFAAVLSKWNIINIVYSYTYLCFRTECIDYGRDPNEIKTWREMTWNTMKQRMSIVCIDSVTNRLAAVNFLWVISRDDNFGTQTKAAVN